MRADQVDVVEVHADGVVLFHGPHGDMTAWRNAAGWCDAETDETLDPRVSLILDQVLYRYHGIAGGDV